MITKVNLCRPYGAYNLNNSTQPKAVCSTPSFGTGADKFVKNIAQEAVPIPINEAITKILSKIKDSGFQETEQALLNEDAQVILKNLYLKAKKISEDQINLSIVYSNASTDGSVAIASGSKDALVGAVKGEGFFGEIQAKLRKTSENLIFRETKKLED